VDLGGFAWIWADLRGCKINKRASAAPHIMTQVSSEKALSWKSKRSHRLVFQRRNSHA